MYPIEKRCSQAQRTLELKRLKTEKPQVTSEKEKKTTIHTCVSILMLYLVRFPSVALWWSVLLT